MTRASDAHNAITADFIKRVGRECETYAEVMVVVESMLLGAMLLNMKLHGCKPHAASGMVEAAVQTAIERFTAQIEGR